MHPIFFVFHSNFVEGFAFFSRISLQKAEQMIASFCYPYRHFWVPLPKAMLCFAASHFDVAI
jgi:hypothetical protein